MNCGFNKLRNNIRLKYLFWSSDKLGLDFGIFQFDSSNNFVKYNKNKKLQARQLV